MNDMKERLIQELVAAANNGKQIGVSRDIDEWNFDTLEFIPESVYVYEEHVEICGNDGEHFIGLAGGIGYSPDEEAFVVKSGSLTTSISF